MTIYNLQFRLQRYVFFSRLTNFEPRFLTFSLFHLLTSSPLREFTATILLVIEVKFFQQLVTTFIEATLAPVLGPKGGTLNSLFCKMPSILDLFEALPTAGGKCGGKVLDAKFLCLTGSNGQAEGKALLASTASFRLTFQPADILTPLFVVVIAINPGHSETLGMTLTLVLSDLIFLTRKDIRIVIENGRAYIMLYQPFNNGRRTRCTTGMK